MSRYNNIIIIPSASKKTSPKEENVTYKSAREEVIEEDDKVKTVVSDKKSCMNDQPPNKSGEDGCESLGKHKLKTPRTSKSWATNYLKSIGQTNTIKLNMLPSTKKDVQATGTKHIIIGQLTSNPEKSAIPIINSQAIITTSSVNVQNNQIGNLEFVPNDAMVTGQDLNLLHCHSVANLDNNQVNYEPYSRMDHTITAQSQLNSNNLANINNNPGSYQDFISNKPMVTGQSQHYFHCNSIANINNNQGMYQDPMIAHAPTCCLPNNFSCVNPISVNNFPTYSSAYYPTTQQQYPSTWPEYSIQNIHNATPCCTSYGYDCCTNSNRQLCKETVPVPVNAIATNVSSYCKNNEPKENNFEDCKELRNKPIMKSDEQVDGKLQKRKQEDKYSREDKYTEEKKQRKIDKYGKDGKSTKRYKKSDTYIYDKPANLHKTNKYVEKDKHDEIRKNRNLQQSTKDDKKMCNQLKSVVRRTHNYKLDADNTEIIKKAVDERQHYAFSTHKRRNNEEINIDLRSKIKRKIIKHDNEQENNTQHQKHITNTVVQSRKAVKHSPIKKNVHNKDKPIKEIKLVIKIVRDNDSDSSDNDKESPSSENNNDLSFLDDINVDEIIDSLEMSEIKTKKQCVKMSPELKLYDLSSLKTNPDKLVIDETAVCSKCCNTVIVGKRDKNEDKEHHNQHKITNDLAKSASNTTTQDTNQNYDLKNKVLTVKNSDSKIGKEEIDTRKGINNLKYIVEKGTNEISDTNQIYNLIDRELSNLHGLNLEQNFPGNNLQATLKLNDKVVVASAQAFAIIEKTHPNKIVVNKCEENTTNNNEMIDLTSIEATVTASIDLTDDARFRQPFTRQENKNTTQANTDDPCLNEPSNCEIDLTNDCILNSNENKYTPSMKKDCDTLITGVIRSVTESNSNKHEIFVDEKRDSNNDKQEKIQTQISINQKKEKNITDISISLEDNKEIANVNEYNGKIHDNENTIRENKNMTEKYNSFKNNPLVNNSKNSIKQDIEIIKQENTIATDDTQFTKNNKTNRENNIQNTPIKECMTDNKKQEHIPKEKILIKEEHNTSDKDSSLSSTNNMIIHNNENNKQLSIQICEVKNNTIKGKEKITKIPEAKVTDIDNLTTPINKKVINTTKNNTQSINLPEKQCQVMKNKKQERGNAIVKQKHNSTEFDSSTSYTKNNVTNKIPDKVVLKKLEAGISEYLGEKHYIQNDKIRQGRFSKIYKMKNLKGKLFAVKVLKDRITNEGIRLAETLCTHVANDIWINFSDSLFCYIMDFYPMNLKQALDRMGKPFPTNHVELLARQLVSAVTKLKINDIIHSDIKPSHVLINAKHDAIKLCGFDRAFYKSSIDRTPPPHIGTSCYRAPEIILGYGINFSIDVWSTALVIFEMATSITLFPGIFNNDILFMQMCTLGLLPYNMLCESKYMDAYYQGLVFKRRSGPKGQIISYIHISNIQINNKLQSAIFHNHYKANKWGRKQETAMKCKLNDLLLKMLCHHPNYRLGIEYVLRHPFFSYPCTDIM